MREYVPEIKRRLEELNIVIELFTIRWFMTIFSSTLSQEVFYRMFEIFLNEGWIIIFKVGLTLIKDH